MYSRSILETLTVATNRFVRTFNTTSTTQTEALNISKAFKGFWLAGLL